MVKPILEEIKKPTTKTAGLWLVKIEGNIVGMLERFKNSKYETHPWKAFKGWGIKAEFLGSFFENEGGKDAAIKAILS